MDKEKKFPGQNELVLCTVNRILGTTVFVKLDSYGKEGVIATSEVAPGRIRNIRDYVVPNKKIVCKVLRIDETTGNIDLSLRRVKAKEKAEIIGRNERERNALTILKMVLKEKSDNILNELKKENLTEFEFLQKIEEIDPQKFGITKPDYEQLKKIVKEKPQKSIFIKEKFGIKTQAPNGITIIRSLLEKVTGSKKNVSISYISAPAYMINIESKNYKEGNKELEEVKKRITEEAKRNGCEVEFKK